ncbi:MAG: chloride channel protein, partial [Salinigranum sp.]
MDLREPLGGIVGLLPAAPEKFKETDTIVLYLLAFVIGIIAGIGAIVFRIAIWVAQLFFFGPAINPGSVAFSLKRLPSFLGG